MKRYEMAVIRRAVGRVVQAVGTHRVIVTADRASPMSLCYRAQPVGHDMYHPRPSWYPCLFQRIFPEDFGERRIISEGYSNFALFVATINELITIFSLDRKL